MCTLAHLVGVVRVDEVECAGRRAAERGGAATATARLLGVGRLRRPVGVRQLAEKRVRRGGRGRDHGRGHGGQAAQPVGHRVRVELDLRVVEVLLAVTAVRVTATPTNRQEDTSGEGRRTEENKDKCPREC